MKTKRTSILDTLPESIRIVSRDKKVLWVNRGFEKLVGMDKEKQCGEECRTYFCPESLLGAEDCYFDMVDAAKPVPQREITYKDGEGNSMVFLASYTPYRDETSGGGGIGFL